MFAVLKVLLTSVLLIDARVTTLDGQIVQGSLTSIDSDNVAVEKDDSTLKTLPLADVVEVEFTSGEDSPLEAKGRLLEVVLADGSIVRAAELTASVETVTGRSELVSDELAIPRDTVRALRLQELKPEWRAEWAAFLERENARDILVVLKRDGAGLDFLSGVVAHVGAEEVQFLLDGDEIPVPRARVFGVVFSLGRDAVADDSAAVLLQLEDGSAFNQQKGRPPTAVELRVEADGQAVLTRLVKATDDPFPLDLDVTGITTLAVIVDFGDGSSTCDYLDLADARLLVDTAGK